MKEYIVSADMAGQRMDEYLKRILPQLPTSLMFKSLRKKNITLNGKKAEGSELLREGDSVRVFFSDETILGFGKDVSQSGNKSDGNVSQKVKKVRNQGFSQVPRLLYEEERFLAFYKPVGMLTQKAKEGDESLNDYLLDFLGRDPDALYTPSVCNRLDRNTGGIVLCAKTMQGARLLSDLLKDHSAEKYYLALVKGRVPSSYEGKILTSYLEKDEKSNLSKIYDEPEEGRKEIRTGIRILAANQEASLLELRLYTGRSHQLRAQLSHIGHPMLGDKKYEGPSARPADAKGGKAGASQSGRGQLLWAYRVLLPLDPSLTITDTPDEAFLSAAKHCLGEAALSFLRKE